MAVQGTKIKWDRLGLDPSVIATNSARIKARFKSWGGPPKEKPVALVAFGQSLNETWREVEGFKTIFTCSGAHKFLSEKGIIPTFHVESDPQPHKVKMLGIPCHDTTYIMASCCHPNYFDVLERCEVNIQLYHIYFPDDRALCATPRREWLITGGHTIGVRMMKLAYLLGYRDVHLFGFDGSGKYAAQHSKPVSDSGWFNVSIDGKDYPTHHSLQYHTVSLFNELNHSMQDLKVTFHGDGLAQAIGRHFKQTKGEKWPIAVMLEE